MKRLLLAVFLASPTIFCMDFKTEKAIAAALKKELEAILNGEKKPERQPVTRTSMLVALQKAFGNHGPEQVGAGCIDTIYYCYGEMNESARAYTRRFLEATMPRYEHERIVCHMLRGCVQPQSKL